MNFNTVQRTYTQWRDYVRTVSALQALDTRELDDLGIARWQIRQIAWKASR